MPLSHALAVKVLPLNRTESEMFDAFASLDLPRTLVLKEEDIRSAYRTVGKREHPDDGGNEEAFAQMSQAYQILLSPARRLRHWLELQGVRGDSRGVIDGALLEDFGRVGQCLQETDQLLSQHETCHSQLAKALLQPKIQQQRESIDGLQAHLEILTQEKTSAFLQIDKLDHEQAWTLVRDLTFLEKWQQQLRDRYGKCFV